MIRLCFLILFPIFCCGQTVPRRGIFSVMASYGTSSTLQQPKVTLLNGPYQLRPETVENPECYDDNGRLVDCNGSGRQLSLGVQYRLSNRQQTAGWMLFANASMQQQVYTLNYPANRGFAIPVACTPSIRRLLRSTGASASVGRFWNIQQNGNTQVFVRLGVMVARSFEYLRGVTSVTLPDSRPLQYVSNGNGTIIEMYSQVPTHNWLITPEIGLTGHNLPFELAASVQLPFLSPVVFSELHTFAERNRITGQNRVDYSNATVNLTARLGFNLSRKNRQVRATSRQKPVNVPEEPRPTPDPPRVHRPESSASDRFSRTSLNTPVKLLVNFDQSESVLLPDSFDDLDRLVAWLQRYPTAEIRLEGHTDLLGDEAENLALSRRRVVAVKDYLSYWGIASHRVETAYFGESRPISRNCPPPLYCPENRRVEMVITKR